MIVSRTDVTDDADDEEDEATVAEENEVMSNEIFMLVLWSSCSRVIQLDSG